MTPRGVPAGVFEALFLNPAKNKSSKQKRDRGYFLKHIETRMHISFLY